MQPQSNELVYVKTYKHFHIKQTDIAGGITTRYIVMSRRNEILGWVRWYSPWNRWCFLPCEGTVWSDNCLTDIVDFILGLAKKGN